MKSGRKTLIAAVLTGGFLIAGIASPALAVDEETGSITCSTGRTAILKTSDTGRWYEHRRGYRGGAIVNQASGNFSGTIHTSVYGTGSQSYYAAAEVTTNTTLWGCYS